MPDQHRDDDRDQRGQDHLPLGRGGHDRHRVAVVRLLGPVHDPGLLAELLSHLLDHLAAGAADGLDRQRREQVDHDPADQEADQDLGRREVEQGVEVEPGGRLLEQLDLERREQHQRGQRRGADRVALRDRLGRVADRVERVGDVADVLGQLGHLGDAARVVGDRPERVEGDDQAGQRELGDDGDRDPVDARQLVGDEDRGREQDARGAPWTGSPGRAPG